MKGSILREKSFDFAKCIIKTYKFLINEKKEYVLSKQLLRSGTSIGANIREAQYAQSQKDFISKLSIALKEANETEYWIELLRDEYLSDEMAKSLHCDVIELIKLLTASINTAKKRVNK